MVCAAVKVMRHRAKPLLAGIGFNYDPSELGFTRKRSEVYVLLTSLNLVLIGLVITGERQ